MISETRSLFKYEFVLFFCWWWGFSLLYLAWQATLSLPTILYSPYFIIGIILVLIGLYSAVARARALMEDRKAFAGRGTISP
jgi:hypothetical protein